MFDDESVMEFCILHGITVQQYFFLYTMARKDFHKSDKDSILRRYIQQVEQFSLDAILALIEKGFVEDMNSPGQSYPELFVLSKKARRLFADYDMAEELWDAYPVTLPLYGKGSQFLARTGGDKEELCNDYLRRIKHSTAKHQYIMEQLEIYKYLTSKGELNGYKISDWIRMELWDSIGTYVKDKTEGGFGKDI